MLNELSAILSRKFGVNWPQIGNIVTELTSRCAVVQVTLSSVQTAIQLAERYGYRYYDCLILATALEHGCGIVFSEDMQHGQLIADQLAVLNLFLLKAIP